MSIGENNADVAYAEEGIYERFRTRYMNRVAEWDNGRLFSITGGLLLLASALIFIGAIVPGGNYISTIFGIPAGVILAIVFLGMKQAQLNKSSNKITMRERLSPRKRTRFSIISAVVAFVAVGLLAPNIPYAAGGALLLAVLISIGDFMRLTPDEKYRQQEEIIDPRDYDEQPVYVEPEEIAGDFSWNENETADWDDNIQSQEYPSSVERG